MTRKIKIAVFASGSGSNFAAIEEACRNGELNAEIVLMVTNKPEAFVVERAEKAGIPSCGVPAERFRYERYIRGSDSCTHFMKQGRNGSFLQAICA